MEQQTNPVTLSPFARMKIPINRFIPLAHLFSITVKRSDSTLWFLKINSPWEKIFNQSHPLPPALWKWVVWSEMIQNLYFCENSRKPIKKLAVKEKSRFATEPNIDKPKIHGLHVKRKAFHHSLRSHSSLSTNLHNGFFMRWWLLWANISISASLYSASHQVPPWRLASINLIAPLNTEKFHAIKKHCIYSIQFGCN